MINIMYYYSHAHIDTGSPKALMGLIELLDKTKYKPYFLQTKNGPLIGMLKEKKVSIINHNLKEHFSMTNIIKISKLLKHNNIKILHVNEFYCSINLVLAAWLAKAKLILHVHNPISLSMLNINAILANKVLLGSEFTKTQITNYKYIKHKTRVIYNYIDFHSIDNAHDIRDVLGIGDKDIAIGVIGQIAPQKGHDKVINLAYRLVNSGYNNVKFFFSGRIHEGCEEFYEKQIIDKISEFNLENSVSLLGIRNDIPSLLKSFDIFILLTKTENFCLAVAEAMAARLPIITQRVGAIPELLNEEDLGFLVNESTSNKTIYNLLTYLICNDILRQQVGAAARESMNNRLDFPSISKQINECYEQLV
jgi:glycosyltransferase involved in cell wall biosynthesis